MRQLVLVTLLIASIVATQYLYGSIDTKGTDAVSIIPSPEVVRTLDFGLHAAVASFLWIDTMPEIIELTDDNQMFLKKLDLVTAIEPKLSFPYAFATLVLPTIRKYSGRITSTIDFGERGMKDAAPDWRIPFYLAVTYLLDIGDHARATELFDKAASTPGVPEHIMLFGINFPTLSKNLRTQTRAIWEAIRDSAKDKETKKRAGVYLYRIEIVELLESAAKTYKLKLGVYPKTSSDLVKERIITSIPEDPFGFEFEFREDGSVQVITPKN